MDVRSILSAQVAGNRNPAPPLRNRRQDVNGVPVLLPYWLMQSDITVLRRSAKRVLPRARMISAFEAKTQAFRFFVYTIPMPTALRFGGLRVVVYPNDHRPSHVHVIGNGHEAVFELNCPVGPVTLRENYEFSSVDLTRIRRELQRNVVALCGAWEGIHGTA